LRLLVLLLFLRFALGLVETGLDYFQFPAHAKAAMAEGLVGKTTSP
jgi:hypothetical protein